MQETRGRLTEKLPSCGKQACKEKVTVDLFAIGHGIQDIGKELGQANVVVGADAFALELSVDGSSVSWNFFGLGGSIVANVVQNEIDGQGGFGRLTTF